MQSSKYMHLAPLLQQIRLSESMCFIAFRRMFSSCEVLLSVGFHLFSQTVNLSQLRWYFRFCREFIVLVYYKIQLHNLPTICLSCRGIFRQH